MPEGSHLEPHAHENMANSWRYNTCGKGLHTHGTQIYRLNPKIKISFRDHSSDGHVSPTTVEVSAQVSQKVCLVTKQ